VRVTFAKEPIIANIVEMFNETQPGAPIPAGHLSLERVSECCKTLSAMYGAARAPFVLPEDQVRIGNMEPTKQLCKFLGKKMMGVAEEYPRLVGVLGGVADVDLDLLDLSLLEHYLALARQGLGGAELNAQLAWQRGGHAATFDDCVPLHTDLIIAASNFEGVIVEGDDPRILRKVMADQRMNYLLELDTVEGDESQCSKCLGMFSREEVPAHLVQLGPCRSLIQNAVGKKNMYPCRDCPDANCVRRASEYPFLIKDNRNRHEISHLLCYPCKGAKGNKEEGCGKTDCN